MRPDLILYRVIRGILVLFSKLFWRLTVEGIDHVPKHGSFVLAPVHRSNIDTIVVSAVTTRRMRYMGKDSMWKFRAPGWLFTALGAFPVHRGTADREALRRCVDVINGGEPLVIFPEGNRRSGSVVEDLFEGAAYIAARTGVPIIPVGIGGSEAAMPVSAKMIRPAKVHLIVGPPIIPEAPPEGGRAPRRVLRETTERLQKELQSLFDAAQQRVR